ncbi:MAG TPA: ChbG/HpnK family deacetylase, partial [Nitrospiria bacterium]|nr:ChbG/HpnK family deacetylase [Nitrospiria bacterium]
MASRLILNGDDFGMSREVNSGILLAHTEGLLTSASLMVNGLAAPEAVDLAMRHPTLAVGLHVVLVQGRSTLGPAEIPDLIDAERRFGDAPFRLGLRYFFKPGIEQQIESEVRAQIEKFLAFGLPLSHVDGHLHFHLHPTVFKILLKLSKEYPIRSVRLTRDRFWMNIRFDSGKLWTKAIHYFLFALLSHYAKKGLKAHG